MLPDEAFEVIKTARNELRDIQRTLKSADEWHAVASVLNMLDAEIDNHIDIKLLVDLGAWPC